ncbi:hypothetical protein GCM10028815_09090 [Mariniluteicoccus flavus]
MNVSNVRKGRTGCGLRPGFHTNNGAVCGSGGSQCDTGQRIPTSLANAMLAGVLLTLCVAPFASLAKNPAAIGPVVVVWLVLLRVAPTWAVPAALVAGLGVMAATGSLWRAGDPPLLPSPGLVAPHFDLAACVAIGVPLFLVTMTSQNIPGVP